MSDDRSRGVHLTEKQLVFVFMAGTVIAVVVFLCGVLVGRGVQERRGQAPDASMITPGAIVSDGGADPVPADAASPAVPVAAPAAGKTGAPDLSYAERLGRTPPATEQMKAPATTAPAPAVERVPPAEASEYAGDTAATDSGALPFTVQVAAVKKRAEADAIVKSLKTQGYDAFVFVPEGDTLGVFRVRVGSFPTRREAENLAQRIAREKRYKPWVTR